MGVNRKKIDLAIKTDRSTPAPITVPSSLFKLPAVMIACARRNAGKTTVMASLLRSYKDAGFVDRAFLISPNADSHVNKNLFKDVVRPDDVRADGSIASLYSVLAELEQDAVDFRKYQEAMKVWKKIQPYLHKGKGPFDQVVNNIPADLLILAHELDVIDGPPKSKWVGSHPSHWIIFDDCQSSPVFSAFKSPLQSIGIRNRHLFGIGVSLMICVQNYSTQGGLSRGIRENATQYMIWRQASEVRRREMAETLSNDVDEDTFLKALDVATNTGDPHDFLTLDVEETNPARRFRKRFDKFIVMQPGDDEPKE